MRDIKWFILISLLLSVLLYAPDQISELYRVIYANVCWNWHPSWFFRELPACLDEKSVAGSIWLVVAGIGRLFWFYLTVFAVGFFIWFGANQVAAESIFRMRQPEAWVRRWSLRLPAIVAALPLIACAFGQFFSLPEFLGSDAPGAGEIRAVGESAQDKAEKWADSATAGLVVGSILTLLLGGGLYWRAYLLAKSINVHAQQMNEPYFYNKRFLGLTTLLFVGITLAFVVWPVPLPQLLTVFGVLALFTLCIVAFCLYLSLLTIEYRLPVISGLLVFAFVLSILDWNDNHTIRVIVPGENVERPKAAMKSAAEEFERWYESRPNLEAYDEYPVYLVAAQGGGMYAAYQTAVFLARLQDNCPAFRNHLFAISSVSGGSVGAATFVSALRFAEQAEETRSATKVEGNIADPCPIIAEYFRALRQRSGENQKKQQESEEELVEADEKAGKLERIVRRTRRNRPPVSPRGCDVVPRFRAAIYPDSTSVFGPCTRARTGIRIRDVRT